MNIRNKKLTCAAAVILCVAAAARVMIFSLSGFNIGTDRQFVWDSRLIDSGKTTAQLTYHRPVRQETVFTADSPWEGTIADNFTIVTHPGGHRLYYSTYDTKDSVTVCCAESSDGISWTKPVLNLAQYNGISENNILFDSSAGITGGFFPFYDSNPAAPDGHRFKAVAVKDDGSIHTFISADGLEWKNTGTVGKNTVCAGIQATLASVFWDNTQQKYLCFYVGEENGQQKIMYTSSKDFEKWTAGKTADYSCRPQTVLNSAGIIPYYRNSDMLIGMPLRVVTTEASPAENGFDSDILTDCVFISSTDGEKFTSSEAAWLTPGPQNDNNWTFGDCFAAGGIVETASLHADKGQDNELSVYVAENMMTENPASLARYTMRIDGFASYSAPFNTAKVVTKPLIFEGGRMTVNFSTSTDGYVYVRILDKNGKPFEDISYTAEDGTEYTVPAYTSYKMIGDRVDREVVFNGDISLLKGEKVIIEFYMSDAELYSFCFDNDPYTTNTEWQPQEIEIREYSTYSCNNTAQVTDISTERQLFTDDYIVDTEKTDAVLTNHSPVRKEALFTTDLPWEGDNCDFYVIVDDTDDEGNPWYRMYYLGWDSSNFTDIRVCYAYSYDGINWTKPSLGLHSFTDKNTGETFTDTNIVLYTEEEIFDNFFVMKDTRPGVPDSERYKAICQGRYDQLGFSSYGLWAWVSPDGLHWKKTHRVLPQLEEWFGSFDSVNSLVWDEKTQQFFTYFRVRENREYKGMEFVDFRKIYGAYGDDFKPFETDTMFELNYGEGAPLFEMYTNNISKYYRAPQLFIGFPTRFSRNYIWQKNYEYLSSPEARLEKFNSGQLTRTLSMTDTMFMTSRDGFSWNRQNEAFFTPGPEYEANWIYGNCYPAYGLVETAGDMPGEDRQLSTYLFEGKFYNEPTVFYRYALRLDGFTSYKADSKTAKVVTKPLTFEGSSLEVNFSTSAAGSLQVNILDEAGQPMEGYCSSLLTGDSTDRTVYFEKDLSALNGQPVIVEFTLKEADIYSFKFQ